MSLQKSIHQPKSCAETHEDQLSNRSNNSPTGIHNLQYKIVAG